MCFHRQMGDSAKRLHNRRSDGDVGNEVSVHYIYMNPIGPSSLGVSDLLPETSKVGGKNRRSEFDDMVFHLARFLSRSQLRDIPFVPFEIAHATLPTAPGLTGSSWNSLKRELTTCFTES